MRYISIFSGIEAASVAWEPFGWEPVAFSEIDEFPSAVLRSRYPNVPNLGDITRVDWTEYRGTVDLVVGGSPCQSFSIAGKREGLSGASGLMWEYIRCIQDVMPEWLIWENVPGALSSERGWAFEQLLSSLDVLGYGLAWRVLDAQFFGVAQRRRRVFLVGHLGDMRACKVLFESEGLRWDTPSSREKREGLTQAAGRSASSGSRGQSYVMKVRGCNDTYVKHDGSIGTAGKGALVGDECAYTVAVTQDQTLVMASGQANAEITSDGSTPTITCLKDKPIVFDRAAISQGANAKFAPSITRSEIASTITTGGAGGGCVQSNGANLVGALCARDYKGLGSQYFEEGKVVACRVMTWQTPTP